MASIVVSHKNVKKSSGLYISTVGFIKRFNVYGFRCQVSGFRRNIGVSEVGRATVDAARR